VKTIDNYLITFKLRQLSETLAEKKNKQVDDVYL